LAFSLGMAIGPAVGSAISQAYSINALFYCSSVFALLSIVILMNMKETLPATQRQRLGVQSFRISRTDVIDPRVIPAALVTLLSYVAYGAILALIPDWTTYLGISNRGVFFVAFTVSSVAVRFFSGRLSDQHGRVLVIEYGLAILILSMGILTWCESPIGLVVGAAIYGIGGGILSPAVNAWTIDLSNPSQRGKAMATMYIALEAGIGLGALIAGWVYYDRIARVPYIFFGTMVVAAFAWLYVRIYKRREQKF